MKLTLPLVSCAWLLGSVLQAENPADEEGANADLPRYIHVSLSIFDVSDAIAKEVFGTTAAVADHSEAVKLLDSLTDKEGVSLVARSGLPVLSGSIGKLNLTEKFDYPEINWATDGKSFQITQEQREFGTILEFEPVFGDHVPEYVWLDYKLIHTPYMPRIRDVEITLPEERGLKPKVIWAYNREFASSVVIRNRASLMIGSFMIVDQESEHRDYRLLFLTVNLPDPKVEQDGADQPATAPESKPEGHSNPKPESEGRSQ